LVIKNLDLELDADLDTDPNPQLEKMLDPDLYPDLEKKFSECRIWICQTNSFEFTTLTVGARGSS
jgi:hypothetical protein